MVTFVIFFQVNYQGVVLRKHPGGTTEKVSKQREQVYSLNTTQKSKIVILKYKAVTRTILQVHKFKSTKIACVLINLSAFKIYEFGRTFPARHPVPLAS